MEFPFLVDGFTSEIARCQAIADEAEAYLAALAGNPIPGKEDAADDMPECLEWVRRVERWGLPHGKGFLAEPYHFMQDLEWAMVGKRRHEAAQAINAANRGAKHE